MLYALEHSRPPGDQGQAESSLTGFLVVEYLRRAVSLVSHSNHAITVISILIMRNKPQKPININCNVCITSVLWESLSFNLLLVSVFVDDGSPHYNGYLLLCLTLAVRIKASRNVVRNGSHASLTHILGLNFTLVAALARSRPLSKSMAMRFSGLIWSVGLSWVNR